MRSRQAVNLVAVAGLVLVQGACATMHMRSNKLRITVPENGQNVPRLALNMDHVTPDVQFFEGGRQLELQAVPDHLWSTAFHNAMAQTVASTSCTAPCTYSWTVQTASFGPGLYLDPRHEHVLRIVRGGQEATVTVHTVWKAKWWFYDMALFVFAPVGWVVDGVTGSWNQFPRLDVDRAFRDASTRSGGSHE